MPEYLQERVKLFASAVNFNILTKTCSLNKTEKCATSCYIAQFDFLVSVYCGAYGWTNILRDVR